MTPWGSLALNPEADRLERLKRGLEALHRGVGGVATSIGNALALPGDVAAGKFVTQPTTPGMWSDEDEARAQLNDREALARVTDLGGTVMGSTIPAVVGHVARHGTKALTKPDTLGIFAGASAVTADLNKLAQAQKMAREGTLPNEIWETTGWIQGPDKKWRFEIDDSKMTVRPDASRLGYETTLGQIVDHPEFFAAYPDAKNIRMAWGEPPGRAGYTSSAYPGDPERIHLSQFDSPQTHRSLGLHEMQHAVQERENFARGGNTRMFTQQDDAQIARDALSWRKELDRMPADMTPHAREEAALQQYRDLDAHDFIPKKEARLIAHDMEGNPNAQLQEIVALYGLDKRVTPYTPTEMYKRLAGEVEARNVQTRRDMTAEQRIRDPRNTAEFTPDQQIVRGELSMDDLEDVLAGKMPLRPPSEHAVWSPFDNAGVYREKALRDAERGGSSVRMFPSQGALDAWRGGTPAADSWDRAVAEAKAGFGAAKGEAREIMNDARAGLSADDMAFLENNMQWSTGDVPAFKPGQLPMDEASRMARAAEQGFMRDAFHGTQAPDFDAFKRKRNDIGIHFGTADQANDRMTYMRDAGHRPEDGMRVLPVKLKVNNPLRVTDLGMWNSDNLFWGLGNLRKPDGTPVFDKEELRRAAFTGRNEAARTADLRDFLERKGYDGLVYRNTGEVGGSEPYRETIKAARDELQAAFPGKKGSWSFSPEEQKHPAYIKWRKANDSYDRHREAMGEDSFIAFRPQQVRSRFAAFDPKKKDSGNLLASVAGLAGVDILRRYGLVTDEEM